jgi:hypothetical protein
MKIFKDEDLKEEIKDFDLGILDAGLSKKYTYYIYNEIKADLVDLVFAVNNKEVEILEAPKFLLANHMAKFIIEWKPSITLREGLHAEIDIKCKERFS